MSLMAELGPTALKTLGGLGLVLLGGRLLMRRVFELVAEAKSEETFIALCLLSVTGASLLTQRLGFSDTLGAFVAGVLLSGAWVWEGADGGGRGRTGGGSPGLERGGGCNPCGAALA